ncbi:hypothetical protein [Roseofilum capinflatum]|uniref:G domain-containing protein n=1 Tax=Roseofilum capinflatum BLCC-M114 TaxID=3022440 RepID=A0ABT7B6D1_9CYAN|nr:hypothetical protein [Roseofilum capinflatum]MDJ1174734.1 hypothetical protein [Roseofilum capinflatum BLCC-M114]
MNQQLSYKTFRVDINTQTLLDDFAPVFINDISQKFQPIFELKEDYCSRLETHCQQLQSFSEFSALVTTLRQYAQKLNDDFWDCTENVQYFTLVFMGAVSAGKTSMICDLLNVNPDQLNQALQSCNNFETGRDDVAIALEVATTNVYEFLVDSSHIRLVDIPGTGGVVHDNTTIAPFVNKADCVIFLCNATSDLTRDDYDFVVRHIVGLRDANELTSDTASDKKALIVINKWNTAVEDLPPAKQKQQWRKKQEWILWGDSKTTKNGNFKGLSDLFKRTLTIVPATTCKRFFDEDTQRYERYGKLELEQVIDALKNILLEEGLEIKLERPKIILKKSLSETRELLANERTQRSVDELVEKLKQMGVKIAVDSNSIMLLLNSRLDNLQNRLKNDLFYQIKEGFDQWRPSVSVMDRIKGLWPKQWWGSDTFGAKAVQEELKSRWKSEIEDLLSQSIRPQDIKRTVSDEADSIGKLLEATFKAQLAELQNEVLKEKLSRGVSIKSFDGGNLGLSGSGKALEEAVNKAVSEIQRSIVDDIIGIVTVDAILAVLLGVFLTPVGSAVFFAVRRWMTGQAEERKAKQQLEDQIWRVADEASTELQEKVANKLRNTVQQSVDSITQVIQGEQESLSQLLEALDVAITTVENTRDRLEILSK